MPLDMFVVLHNVFLMWRKVQFKGSICFKLVLRILDLGLLSKIVPNLQATICVQLGFLVFCNQIVFLEVNFELKSSCEFACVLQIEISAEKRKIPRPFFHMLISIDKIWIDGQVMTYLPEPFSCTIKKMAVNYN
jgi:hypothetical protein